MVGLWQNGQKVMLGLVVNPKEILPHVLAFSVMDRWKRLYLNRMKPLPLSHDNIADSLHHLARIIVYFNSI